MYVALGISTHFTFKPLLSLFNFSMFKFTTICPMTYDTLLGFRALFSALYPCVLGQPYSLTSFSLCAGFSVRLGNVYGCFALAFISVFYNPFLVRLQFSNIHFSMHRSLRNVLLLLLFVLKSKREKPPNNYA